MSQRVTEDLPPHLQNLDEYSDPQLLRERLMYWQRQKEARDAGELPPEPRLPPYRAPR